MADANVPHQQFSFSLILVFFLIFPLILSILPVLLRRYFKDSSSQMTNLPPSPPSVPFIGHSLLLLRQLPHQALHKLSTIYGPFLYLRVGSVPAIIVSSASTAREVLKINDQAFASRPMLSVAEVIWYGSSGLLFAPFGSMWKLMRKLCMSELFGSRALDRFLEVRAEEIKLFLRTIADDGGRPVLMGKKLGMLVGNIVFRMALSERLGEVEEVWGLVNEVAKLGGELYLGDFIQFFRWWDFQGCRKRYIILHQRLDNVIEKILRGREESDAERRDDIMDILIGIMRDDAADVKLTRENVKAFILDLCVAGMNTASLTLQWAISELILHPHILRKAQMEIDSAIGKSRLVHESDITNLPYVEAIVKETLRLHPAIPLIARGSITDTKINGYDIPAKAWLIVNIWSIGRDPKEWDLPLEFRPERFVGSERDVKGHNFELIPFGSGRRVCPGVALALNVVNTTLACLIQCFHFEVADGGHERLSMEEGSGLTLAMARPLVCRLKPRHSFAWLRSLT